MKKNIVLAFSFLVFCSFTSLAQNKVVEHKVEKGDTVTSIARKYNVSASDIYRLNPSAAQGIQLDAILKVPVSQTKTVASTTGKKHVVAPKETVYSIARKYEISPADLQLANKEVLKEVLKPGAVLVIPTKNGQPNSNTVVEQVPIKPVKTAASTQSTTDKVKNNPIKNIYHTVSAKETKYGIARQYNLTVAELEKFNPEIKGKEHLEVGVVLRLTDQVPPYGSVHNPADVAGNYIIQPKETLFSLSQKAGLSVSEFLKLNPSLASGVKEGTTIKMPKTTSPSVADLLADDDVVYETYVIQPQETLYSLTKQSGLTVNEFLKLNPNVAQGVQSGTIIKMPKTVVGNNEGIIGSKYTEYVVQPQETFYSLNKRSGLTVNEFLALNPELENGVIAGMTIKMPRNKVQVNKPITDLTLNLAPNSSKNLVLLLPFNTDKYGNNSAVTIQEQLKNDRFANMTLDFYSGALVAIDSAKKLGLPVKVQVLDSKETRTGSNIASLVNKGSFNRADVVIGPFFQNQVENLANLLANQPIAIVSPLSNEKGKPMPNLYQSMPSTEDVKKALIDYMYAKNGNIVAIVDPKKGSMRKYINESFPSVKIAPIKADGLVDANQIRQTLDKSRINFVILETESTALTVSACKTLLNQLKDYDIQLVTLDKNEILESDEIPLTDLTKLKLLYPSVTNDANGLKLTDFAKTYKAQNNTLPNKFATRGFDVTFDTILRLYNQDGFHSTVENAASQQLENKFNYVNVDGAHHNKGVYLLYYDTDLTIKEAK
ncbi:LysM peptidoglycan-binding domain-containing protein [Flavobacterium agricola]|uniref:LysM peptidoglycan-binding domain-containing protein n=1 Tax=Flavobacterium agricola TaxID=2870839 RepID=A0ABY6M4G1_9FLAO|nr:LysM peptidoglycan-binding domain-containing protein [Flavobacterium agricola]UYW02518.1 LysM peptidoglycan-binding domain-containing protein [Flavobacterium agricola]